MTAAARPVTGSGASNPPPSIDELDEAIRRFACATNIATYRMLVLVREFDERLGWAKWSCASCAEWLSWRIGIGLSAAREKVRIAHALHDLPAIAAAFEGGRLSYSKVRALTRAADASNEHVLLEYALSATAPQVEERCRQIRNVRPESTDEARQGWARRSLSVYRNPARNSMTISVELPLEDGELVVRALDKAVQSEDAGSGPEMAGEGWHAQQADALLAMAQAYLAGGSSAPSASAATDGPQANAGGRPVRADRYQVVVHVDEAALRGGAGRSDLPIETVRRIACDASVTVLSENARGEPLSVGRRKRFVPLGLRRALWSRDRGCTFPGCHNNRFVDAHHIEHWVAGGETTAENTALLCTRHHRLVHEGAFRMRRRDDGSLEFRRPDGRRIPACGYRADDAAPDPGVLDEHDCPSTEAWLAALLRRSPVSPPRRSSRSGP